jgi:hypothetical protein
MHSVDGSTYYGHVSTLREQLCELKNERHRKI